MDGIAAAMGTTIPNNSANMMEYKVTVNGIVKCMMDERIRVNNS